jgi:hypothetical protein
MHSEDCCFKYYLNFSELFVTNPVASGEIVIGEYTYPVNLPIIFNFQPGSPHVQNLVITSNVYSDKACQKKVGTVLFNLYTLTNSSIEGYKNRVTSTGTMYIDGKKSKCDSTVSITFGLNLLELPENKKYTTKTITGTGQFDKVNNVTIKKKKGVISLEVC